MALDALQRGDLSSPFHPMRDQVVPLSGPQGGLTIARTKEGAQKYREQLPHVSEADSLLSKEGLPPMGGTFRTGSLFGIGYESADARAQEDWAQRMMLRENSMNDFKRYPTPEAMDHRTSQILEGIRSLDPAIQKQTLDEIQQGVNAKKAGLKKLIQ